MNDYFKGIFNKQPIETIRGDYYFSADADGDKFSDDDVALWLNGIFKDRWDKGGKSDDVLYKGVLDTFGRNPSPFMEVACGPGMGLTPVILSKYPDTLCLATDACSLLIKLWRQYIDSELKRYHIDLASFSVMDIPIKDNSLNMVTSFIGISSTRSGEQGKIRALREVFRVLNKSGYFIAIENEWTDFNAIQQLFKLWGKPMWTGMKEDSTWYEKFEKSGFTVEKSDKAFFKYLSRDDNDLGAQADKYGIKIGLKFTLFILRK